MGIENYLERGKLESHLCDECDGTGKKDGETCPVCKGTGKRN